MKVKCPTCHKETEYNDQNKFRPFCSERCATLDLGAWADEKYKVPVEDFTSENDTDSVNENDPSERKAHEQMPPKDHQN